MKKITQIVLALLFIATPIAHAEPDSVTLPGSFQDELGCPGDWQPDCTATHLTYDAEDTVWQGFFTVPAGNWEYKAALDGAWDENYGLLALHNGPSIPLDLAASTEVKFYYDDKTHWITDNENSVIVTAPGNYQSEQGCSGDWQPWCLRSWLQDPDGDGIFTFTTQSLPAGDYEVKVAIAESWEENYGDDGVQNGPNISFSVPDSCTEMFFTYDHNTHILQISQTGSIIDFDGDGFNSNEDCDDDDVNIFPGADESCDGVDNNCDGSIDEGFDIDTDGIADCFDNCPNDENSTQDDFDEDDTGDVCDICPYDAANDADGDNVCGDVDACPNEDATGFDIDSDGCLDNSNGLVDIINSLPTENLSDKIRNSLKSKVVAALKSIDKGKNQTAINQLSALINQLTAQRGKNISEDTANMLIHYTLNIIAQIQTG